MTGAPAGGTSLTIGGRGFLNLQAPPTVWIGPKAALNVQVASNSEILCSVPKGLGRNLPVRITPSAKLYPSKPIMERYEPHPAAQAEGIPGDVGLEIAGETTTLCTGFSYDGENFASLVRSLL
jgi:hypothetical protein